MTVAWVEYASALGALMLFTGYLLEHISRALRWPTRFAWLGTMAVVVLSASAALAAAPGRVPFDVMPTIGGLRRDLTLPSAAWPEVAAIPLGFALCAASAVAFVVVIGGALHATRLTRPLPRAVVEGATVGLSDELGPAAMGIVAPLVVLPWWVLDLPTEERRMIVRHETEHVRAGDPALLFAGVCLLALQPWNLPLWAMLARFRLAVEADCDARVLTAFGRAPAHIRAYGRLLLAVQERALTPRAPQLGLVERSPDLEWRVLRMIATPPRRRSLVVASSGAACLLALAAALDLPSQPPAVVPPAERPRVFRPARPPARDADRARGTRPPHVIPPTFDVKRDDTRGAHPPRVIPPTFDVRRDEATALAGVPRFVPQPPSVVRKKAVSRRDTPPKVIPRTFVPRAGSPTTLPTG